MKRQRLRFQQGGFSLIEVLIVVAILAVLTSLVLFSFSRARMKASRIKCVNQLKNIGLAYRIFATDNNDSFPFQVAATNGGTLGFEHNIVKQFLALTNELATPKILICITRSFARPGNGYSTETAASSWSTLTPTNIDYFVNLDANESSPERILAGDNCVRINGDFRHGLTLVSSNDTLTFPNRVHARSANDTGNAVFSDGSVQQFSSAQWPAVLNRTALPTNRFLFP